MILMKRTYIFFNKCRAQMPNISIINNKGHKSMIIADENNSGFF